MKPRKVTNKDRRLFREVFSENDVLTCSMYGCRGTAGWSQDYCLKHRRELRIVPEESFSQRYVYFMLAVGTEKIKIGVAGDVELRLSNLQVGSPYKLLLLVSFPGNELLEKILHNLLKPYKVRGEWFKMDDEVLDVIDIALDEGRRGVNLWIEKKKNELLTTTTS